MKPTMPRVVTSNDPQAAQAVQPIYCAPTNKGFAGFMARTTPVSGSDTQLNGAPNQGHLRTADGKPTPIPSGVKGSSNLREYHYLNYEEVLKGILATEVAPPPMASIFGNTMSSASKKTYFEQVSDYLFYESRVANRPSGTSGPLNIAPVPGYNILFMDASETSHHVLGKLQSITHNISSTGGATTQYEISHSREIGEKDLWNGDLAEPPLPPWYSSSFGTRRALKPSDYSTLTPENQAAFKDVRSVNDFSNIGEMYQKTLGKANPNLNWGPDSITNKKYPTVLAAALSIAETYEAYVKNGNTQDFINPQIRRPYVLLEEYFKYLGADITPGQVGVSFVPDPKDLKFTGKIMDGGFVSRAKANKIDKNLEPLFGATSVSRRRKPVDAYLDALNNSQGFRG